jgi:hypothetical protein
MAVGPADPAELRGGYRMLIVASEVVTMTDVLIRNVPEDDLRRIDEKAARLGLSRGEYLRRQISQDAARHDQPVTVEQFSKFADLADEAAMRGAWA